MEFKFKEDVYWRALIVTPSYVEGLLKEAVEEACQQLGFKTFLTYYTWSKFGKGNGLYYEIGNSEIRPSREDDHTAELGLMCIPSKYYFRSFKVEISDYLITTW